LFSLAHGLFFWLFISAGGILYDRSGTRLITYYRGYSSNNAYFFCFILYAILGNCGAPLTLKFCGEFYVFILVFFEITFAGVLASSSIFFSAAYTNI